MKCTFQQEDKWKKMMNEYIVTCWASEQIIVEAENEEEAEQIAAEQCRFPCIDYCEVDEI